jgi:hypothetical protein
VVLLLAFHKRAMMRMGHPSDIGNIRHNEPRLVFHRAI